MRVRYYGHFGQLTGYGRAACDYAQALVRYSDVKLELKPLGNTVDLEPGYRPDLLPCFGQQQEADLVIVHTLPRDCNTVLDVNRADGVPCVAVTTWETDPLPADLQALSVFDVVVVPSSLCERVFRDAGVHAIAVPHAFDPAFWKVGAPTTAGHSTSSPYSFYTLGVWNGRKNPSGLIKAFLSEFDAGDDVRLVIVTSNIDVGAVNSLMVRSGIPLEQLPRIDVPERTLSEAELVDLHAGGDCFVTATRGEGFGLPLFEAAIMGNPVIAPAWGGHRDFLRDYSGSIAYDVTMTPAFPEERTDGREVVVDGRKVRVAALDVAPGVTCKQQWAEPDLTALKDAMRHVYLSRTPKCHAQRVWFERNYGYKAVATQLFTVLEGVLNDGPR
jgi:glycosyltransferase involved in cell wall biosynthesis